jgi:minor extracellular serine protease Vpr
MKSRLLKLFGITLAIMLTAGTVSAQPTPIKSEPLGLDSAQNLDQIPIRSVSSPAVYIVRLDDAPLASYRGGIAGLAATSPSATGQDKLQVNSPASLAYRDYLAQKQDQLIAAMEKRGRHRHELCAYQ